MGIVKALFDSVKGGLADTWLEVIEANNMSDTTVFTKGVTVRKNDKRNNNRKGTEDIISNGSIIHVYDNQFMMLVDGGKVVDFSAEPGYYKVDNSAMPSLFAGQFGKSLAETFGRIRYGGVPSQKQQVFYVNLQEIKGIFMGSTEVDIIIEDSPMLTGIIQKTIYLWSNHGIQSEITTKKHDIIGMNVWIGILDTVTVMILVEDIFRIVLLIQKGKREGRPGFRIDMDKRGVHAVLFQKTDNHLSDPVVTRLTNHTRLDT